MTWSTRQLAELAGITVKTVRHYHQVGLLEEPDRANNGYKHYDVVHLVRLLRIRRLVDLGVPLSQVALMKDGDDPGNALWLIDAELSETIDRLQRIKAELTSDAEFNALPAEADENTRAEFAIRYAPHVRHLTDRYPWISDPGAGSKKGSAFVTGIIGEAMFELFNTAQTDVLRRVDEILHPSAEPVSG